MIPLSHTIRLLIATALLFALGCAQKDWIDRTLVTVDVTGSWSGSVGGPGAGGKPPDVTFELEQQGAIVKGFMHLPAGGSSQGVSYSARINPGPLDGTVSGDVFRFRLRSGTLEGELRVSGDEMEGQVLWSGNRPISLRRVDPSSPLASPPW